MRQSQPHHQVDIFLLQHLSACRPLPDKDTWMPFLTQGRRQQFSQSLGSSSTTRMLCVMTVLVRLRPSPECNRLEGGAGIFLAGAFNAAVVTSMIE